MIRSKLFILLPAVLLGAQLGSALPTRAGDGFLIEDSNGNAFMEEVLPNKPKPKPKPVPIDLSRVGVSVDPHGKIVPLIDHADDPWAASGVKPFYNHIETSTTVPYIAPLPYGVGPYVGAPYAGFPPGGFPYGGYGSSFGYPGYGYPSYGYPGYGFGGLNRKGLLGAALAGAGAGLFSASTGLPPSLAPYNGLTNPYAINPYFGNGAYGYGGYPGYGYPGFMPFATGYTTTGNSATFISNDPVTGAPINQGPGGNSQTNNYSTTGTVSPLPWLAPTGSFQQNSMWKAFNLAF